MSTVNVYVPRDGALHIIDPKSGIVGEPQGDRVLVYFEGNRFEHANVVTFADRCRIAAGRLVESYPTIAKALMPADEVVHVGTFDLDRGIVLPSGDGLAQLAKWLYPEPGANMAAFAAELCETSFRPPARAGMWPGSDAP